MKTVEMEIAGEKLGPYQVWFDDSDQQWHATQPTLEKGIRILVERAVGVGRFGETARAYHTALFIKEEMEPQGWKVKIFTEEPEPDPLPEGEDILY